MCGGVQHIVCCAFLRLVLHVLAVSLDCPFFISVISNVYLIMEMVCISSVHMMGVIDGARKKTVIVKYSYVLYCMYCIAIVYELGAHYKNV